MTAPEPSSQPPRILTEVQRDEQRFDGMWVLRTTTGLSAVEVALRYKQLWMVEQLFRTAKSLLDTRPIFHRTDAARQLIGNSVTSAPG